jgi:hypothetical protein
VKSAIAGVHLLRRANTCGAMTGTADTLCSGQNLPLCRWKNPWCNHGRFHHEGREARRHPPADREPDSGTRSGRCRRGDPCGIRHRDRGAQREFSLEQPLQEGGAVAGRSGENTVAHIGEHERTVCPVTNDLVRCRIDGQQRIAEFFAVGPEVLHENGGRLPGGFRVMVDEPRAARARRGRRTRAEADAAAARLTGSFSASIAAIRCRAPAPRLRFSQACCRIEGGRAA